jgi:hypothetical protein
VCVLTQSKCTEMQPSINILMRILYASLYITLYKPLVNNMKGRDHLREFGTDETISLKHILKEKTVRV